MSDAFRTLQVLAGRCAERGDRTAVVAFQQEDARRWSFQELARCAASLAGGLLEEGLEKGDAVALLAEPQPVWLAMGLAVLQAGATVVPLDVQLSDDDLRRVLVDDGGARRLFTTTTHVERLKRLGLTENRRIGLLDAGEEHDQSWRHHLGGRDHATVQVDPADRAVLFYTSGTTGPPKGVPLSHGNIAFQLNTFLEADFVTERDRFLLPLPLHHVYPFVFGMLFPLAIGCPVVLPFSRTGPQMVRALREAGVTTIIGVPRLYRALIEGLEARAEGQGRVAEALVRAGWTLSEAAERALGVRAGKTLLRPLHEQFGPEVRLLASGGSALEPPLARKLTGLGWQIVTGYGLTETSPLLTWNPPGGEKLGSAGEPLEHTRLRIDRAAEPGSGEADAGDAAAGEILARGPGVFAGYHQLPEKTAETFTEDGWFRTGDLGFFDEEDYLYVTGRVSTRIVTEGGENVQPAEVEEAYQEHSLIREIGVLEHEGELVGVIVPDPGALREQDDEMEEAVRRAVDERSEHVASYQRLADYAVTRRALERTRLGDLRRHKLAERYEEARRGEDVPDGPMAPEEMEATDRALLEEHPPARRTWDWLAERYPDTPLTPDTSPQLDLGIDSIEWVNVTLEISQRTGVQLAEETLARIETVRDLLQAVAEADMREGGGRDAAASLLEDPEGVLTDWQKRWLEPLSPRMDRVARGLYALNRRLVCALLTLRVEGRAHVPAEGPFVLAPNHVSYLDPFVIAAVLNTDRLRRTYWAGYTGVAFNNPLSRLGSRLAQTVPVEHERGARSSLAFGGAVLERGQNLIWFPEGRRSETGELQEFQSGIGALLSRFTVPVVPVFIQGTHAAMPPGAAFPRPRSVAVTFGAPLEPHELEQAGEEEEASDHIARVLHDRVAALEKDRGKG